MQTAEIHPLKEFEYVEKLNHHGLGEELLKEGKAGCIIVAGGQGTRLGYNGPKGCYEILPGVTLFSLLAKKVLNASQKAQKSLPLAIMTSDGNHQQTIDYFKANNYFGLQADNVDFFNQESLPVLSLEGHILLDESGEEIDAPAGNGISLHTFAEQGLAKKWKQLGVEQVSFIQVDNILSDPFDPLLLGYQHLGEQSVTLKAGLRIDPTEKVGVIAEVNGRPGVVEYNEIDEPSRIALNIHGGLLYSCANLGMYCFRLDFIQKLWDENALENMPLHKAKKTIPQANDEIGYKSEYFIFDVLPFSDDTRVLVYPREECFAPLKEPKDIASVQTIAEQLS